MNLYNNNNNNNNFNTGSNHWILAQQCIFQKRFLNNFDSCLEYKSASYTMVYILCFQDVYLDTRNQSGCLYVMNFLKAGLYCIKATISKTRKGIGLRKYLSKYLPSYTLNELYKLCVRLHLDYGDVIYNIPPKLCEVSQSIALSNLMEKVESVQYSAALAVSGTWRGTSWEKLYAELGWGSLSSRRWSRRLTLFYKIINNLTPLYTKQPIPPLQPSNYSLCSQDVIEQITTRTEKFLSSFYPNCIFEWNKLDPEIRLAPSVAVFKAKLSSKFAPPCKVYLLHSGPNRLRSSFSIKGRSQ